MKTVRSIHLIGLLLPALSLAQSAFADVATDLTQARRLCTSGRYVEAEQTCQKTLDTQPSDPETIYQVGKMLPQIYLATDRLAQAQGAVQELLAKSASHEYLPHALQEIIEQAKGLGKAAQAGQMCRNLLDAGPESSQAIWLKMGIAVADVYLGKDPAVDGSVKDIIANNAADPWAAEAIAQIGWAYDKLEEYNRAKPLYEHIVDNWPQKPRAMYAHAALVQDCIRLKDKKAAQSRLGQLSKRYGSDGRLPNVLEEIARGYREAKMFDEGKSLAQYVLDNYPGKDPCIWAQRDVILCDVGLRNQQAAQDGVPKLVQKYAGDQDLPHALNDIAKTFREARMYEQAKPVSQYVLDNYPTDDRCIWAKRDLILCDIAQGNQDAAQSGLQRLVQDRSTDGYLPYVLCEVAGEYRKDRLCDQARSVAKYILDKYPECSECLWAQRDIVLNDLALKDTEAVSTGIQTLLTEYVAQSGVWWAVQDVADAYGAMGQHAQARDLYRWNLTNHSMVDDTIWSLQGFIDESIALKDETSIDTGVKKLLSEYAASKNLPTAAIHVGRELCKAGHSRAPELFQYVIDKYPDSDQALLARVCMGHVYIMQGRDSQAESLYEQIMTKYANHPRLPSIVNVMAEGYFDRAKAAEREQMAAVGFEVYTDEVIMHGRPDAIKRYYQQAARKWEIIVDRFPDAPIVPQAYERAAVCYGYVNDYRRAMECAAAIVDRYPEYVSRDRALFMIGRMCERLRDQGVLTDAEAIPTVLAMSQAILSQYPQSHLAVAAQRVVDRAVETETRERKESTDDTQ